MYDWPIIIETSAMTNRRERCRHCQQRTANRPRGLCATCYDNRTVRECYDQIQRQDHNHWVTPKKIPQPTTVSPGQDKVQVLIERFERGELLFHPLDAKIDTTT